MNEAEKAELFNRDLDALLAGRRPPGSSDAEALEIAASLAAADFSGESSIREELRRRLVKERAGFLAVLYSAFSNNYARAAFAAACLALIVLPLARRTPAPSVPAGLVQEQTAAPLPAEVPPPSSEEALLPVPRAELSFRPAAKPDTGLFASLPMAPLEGEKISQFPIRPAGPAAPIALTGVRRTEADNGSSVTWETENAVFELRREKITIDDLFQVRSL